MRHRNSLWLRIFCGLLLLAFSLAYFAGIHFQVRINSISEIESLQIAPTVMCGGIALWALFTLRKADSYAQKLLLTAIPIVFVLAFLLELINRQGQSSLQFAVTTLYYCFAGLVIVAAFLEAKKL
ncbi:MAG: hypothetical protein IVW54_21770 [Candidatus Binataceae bacterium]|nr:hypothetical protein [Candidatus Binataceae bacterium]